MEIVIVSDLDQFPETVSLIKKINKKITVIIPKNTTYILTKMVNYSELVIIEHNINAKTKFYLASILNYSLILYLSPGYNILSNDFSANNCASLDKTLESELSNIVLKNFPKIFRKYFIFDEIILKKQCHNSNVFIVNLEDWRTQNIQEKFEKLIELEMNYNEHLYSDHAMMSLILPEMNQRIIIEKLYLDPDLIRIFNFYNSIISDSDDFIHWNKEKTVSFYKHNNHFTEYLETNNFYVGFNKNESITKRDEKHSKILCSVYKNGDNIIDWINYHLLLGIDHIYIYIEDDIQWDIYVYIQKKKLTVIKYTGLCYYNHCLLKYGHSDWFLYTKSINDYYTDLKFLDKYWKFTNINSIAVNPSKTTFIPNYFTGESVYVKNLLIDYTEAMKKFPILQKHQIKKLHFCKSAQN